MNKPVVVADAGPLIALAKCGQLGLLPQVFGHIHVLLLHDYRLSGSLVAAVLREAGE